MTRLLVETHVSRETENIVVRHVRDVARAVDQVSEQGADSRLLGAVFLRADETCFYLYLSAAAHAVGEAATRPLAAPGDRRSDFDRAPRTTAPNP